MRKKKRLKRIFSFLFFVTYITNHLYTTAYATTATPATASNAEFPPLSSSFITPEFQSLGLSTYSAVSPAISLDPSSYVLSLLLNSMGIDVSLSALSSWVGSTETYQDYVSAGEQGTLSAWEQWCYDQAKAEGGQALKDSYESNIEWLGKLSWGDTVETIPTEKLHSSAKSLNDWARTFPSYGTNDTSYKRSTTVQVRPPYDEFPDDMVLGWGPTESGTHSTRGRYDEYQAFFIASSYRESGKDYTTIYTSSLSYDGIVGYKDDDSDPPVYVYFYDTNTGKRINKFHYSYFRYWYLTNTYEEYNKGISDLTTQFLYKYVKNSPIPIFGSEDEMYAYTSGGHADAVNGKDKSGLKAKAVNPALQKTSIGALKGLTLPSDENTAKKNLESVNMGTDIDTIIKALTAAGLVIDKSIDIPDESETTDETTTPDKDDTGSTSVSLKTIINKIEQIIQVLSEWNFADWSKTLDNVLINAMTTLGLDSISRALDDIGKWNFADWPLQLSDTLNNTMKSLGLDSVSHVLENIGKWDFADWPLQLSIVFENTMKSLGLDSISHTLENIGKWDFADWPLILSDSVKEAINSLELGNIISVLENILSNIISIPESIARSLSDVLGLADGFSLSSALDRVIELIISLPKSISEELTVEAEKSMENREDDFIYFFKFIIALVLIIVLLIIIFINCLRLIMSIFNIPASTVLFNDYVLKGLQFTKDLQLPIMGVSLYSLLTGLGFFICIISIIGLLRRKADKLHE